MSLLKHRDYNVSTGNIMKKQRPPKSDNNKLSSLYLKTLNEKINEIFTILMGDKVEPRREFITKNAKNVINLDI